MSTREAVGPRHAQSPADQPGADEQTWLRLDPKMLAVHPVLELLRGSPALVALFLLEHGKSNAMLWPLVGVVVVVGIGLLRWLTTTYRLDERQVQVRKGLLSRSVRSVPRDRIRTVDLHTHWMHRLLGLARVDIGTGTADPKGDNGLRLDALSATAATGLRDELLHRRTGRGTAPVPAHAAPESTVDTTGTTGARPAVAVPVPALARGPVGQLVALSPGWLRFAPFTLSGLVGLGVVAAFSSQFLADTKVNLGGSGPVRAFTHQLGSLPTGAAVAEVVLLCYLVVAVTSTLRYVLSFWNFRLTRTPHGTLEVTRGLVSTRTTSIEERRLHGVEVAQPLLLRLPGGARAVAITTGLRGGRGAERSGSLLLPPAPRAVADTVAGAVLGGPAAVAVPLVAHGPVAQRRRYTRAVGVAVLFVSAVAGLSTVAGTPGWTWQLACIAVPFSAMLAKDRYRTLGHALAGSILVTARGSLVRRRAMLSRDGIIGWNLRRSFFARRAGVVTLVATTAAGRQRYLVQDIGLRDGVELAERVVPGLLEPFLAIPSTASAATRREPGQHTEGDTCPTGRSSSPA